MNKILIPTDFSLTAEKSYKLAASIAAKTGAELHFLHVIPNALRKGLSVAFTSIANISEYDKTDEIAAATELLDRIPSRPEFAGLKVETHLISDTKETIPAAITTFEEDNDIDLVITGTDGARTTRRNYAPVIVRTAKCPVITVETAVEEVILKNIVLATDFINVNYSMMDKIWTIQQLFEANLTILYVNTPKHFRDTQNIENEFQLFISKFELDANATQLAVYNEHIPEDGILKYAERVNADMLMMSTHGRRGMANLMNSSYSEYIVGHAKMPVYVHNMYVDQSYYNSMPDAGSFGFGGM